MRKLCMTAMHCCVGGLPWGHARRLRNEKRACRCQEHHWVAFEVFKLESTQSEKQPFLCTFCEAWRVKQTVQRGEERKGKGKTHVAKRRQNESTAKQTGCASPVQLCPEIEHQPHLLRVLGSISGWNLAISFGFCQSLGIHFPFPFLISFPLSYYSYFSKIPRPSLTTFTDRQVVCHDEVVKEYLNPGIERWLSFVRYCHFQFECLADFTANTDRRSADKNVWIIRMRS